MTTWELTERRAGWTVRRNGQWEYTGDAEAAWAYVAERAQDGDLVVVQYVTGRKGPTLTGVGLREMVETT